MAETAGKIRVHLSNLSMSRVHTIGGISILESVGQNTMSSFDWLANKATDALSAISEVGASLFNAGLTSQRESLVATDTTSDETEPEDDASEALARAAEKAVLQEKSGEKRGHTTLNSGAVDTAKNTVQAVLHIAEQFSKLDDKALLSAATPLGGILAAGKMLVNTEKGKLSDITWKSNDNKLRVDKISDTSELADDFAKLWTSIDSPTCKSKTHALDCGNIFSEVKQSGALEKLPTATAKGSAESAAEKGDSVKTGTVSSEAMEALFHHENTSATGVKTTIDGKPGQVRVQTTDASGNPITTVDKSADKTEVKHGSESATRQNGETVFKGKDFRVVVRNGVRHVVLDDGRELVRDGDGAKVIDHRNDSTYTITRNQVRATLSTGQPLVFAQEKDDLEALTREMRSKLQEGQTALIVMTGIGARTIFHDGTVMDIRPDRTTRIRTPDGHIFVMDKDGKLYLQHDGCNTLLDRNNLPAQIQWRDGKFHIGRCEIDPLTLRIIAQQVTVDGATGVQTFQGPRGSSTVRTNSDGTADVADEDNSYHNHGEGEKVVISSTTAPSLGMTIDLATETIETAQIRDTRERTEVKETNTTIDSLGTVNFNGGRGPTLNHDGSVRVDDRTFIGADMSVRSGTWSGSAAVEARASSVAGEAGARAAGVYGKASSGAVRWTDVADLNDALGTVMGLISSVPPHSPSFARLMASYKELVGAINFATPKAQASESAEQKGITDGTLIKDFNEGRLTEDALKLEKRGYWLQIT